VEPELDPAAELRGAQRRMRRRMLAMLGVAAVAAAVAAWLLVTCHRRASELPSIERPFLWEVTGAGAAAPSYLFGTIHIGYEIDDLPAAVLAAQARSHTTVVESDLLEDEADAGAEAADAPAPAPPDHGGRDRLAPEVWRSLAEIIGVDEPTLETWSASRLLGAALARLTPPVVAMDLALQARARDLGKQIAFLETRELEGVMDEGTILEGVDGIARHRAAYRAELLRLLRSYASGDDGDDNAPADDEVGALAGGLNTDWETAIEAHVRGGGAFIAIGNAHLLGPGSIVARLRAKGYDVRRVDRAP
jgi:uncharacterized protein YbaP (TraB family)